MWFDPVLSAGDRNYDLHCRIIEALIKHYQVGRELKTPGSDSMMVSMGNAITDGVNWMRQVKMVADHPRMPIGHDYMIWYTRLAKDAEREQSEFAKSIGAMIELKNADEENDFNSPLAVTRKNIPAASDPDKESIPASLPTCEKCDAVLQPGEHPRLYEGMAICANCAWDIERVREKPLPLARTPRNSQEKKRLIGTLEPVDVPHPDESNKSRAQRAMIQTATALSILTCIFWVTWPLAIPAAIITLAWTKGRSGWLAFWLSLAGAILNPILASMMRGL